MDYVEEIEVEEVAFDGFACDASHRAMFEIEEVEKAEYIFFKRWELHTAHIKCYYVVFVGFLSMTKILHKTYYLSFQNIS